MKKIKRFVSMLLAFVLIFSCVDLSPVFAYSQDDSILKIDGEYEIVATYTGLYDAPTYLVRVPSSTTSVKVNISSEYGAICDKSYQNNLSGKIELGGYYEFSLSEPGVAEGEAVEDWVPAAYVSEELYFLAFVDNFDDVNDIVDVIFYKSDVPVHSESAEEDPIL